MLPLHLAHRESTRDTSDEACKCNPAKRPRHDAHCHEGTNCGRTANDVENASTKLDDCSGIGFRYGDLTHPGIH